MKQPKIKARWWVLLRRDGHVVFAKKRNELCALPVTIRLGHGQVMCGWNLVGDDSYYETECGRAFCFNDGGPKENSFKYCPYCGGKIKKAGR